jgi:5-methylcytosine-specific restriction enzyme subunit McrC
MRTISVKEHESSDWVLSPSELDDLLRTDLVELSPGLGGTYAIRPGSVVGTAVLPHLRLQIEPKVPVGNLVFMLAYGLGIVDWAERDFPYETAAPLSAALAWLYADRVEVALRRGVVRGYVGRTGALAAPVGSPRFERQFAIHQSRPYPIECGYDEFTADIELNQLLLAAHTLLLRRPDMLATTHSRLRHQLTAFEDVTPTVFDPREVPQATFTRLTEHWRGAVQLARLIIEGSTINHHEDEFAAPAFTIDMNQLFERFVSGCVRVAARAAGLATLTQAARPFTQQVGLQPDLLLTTNGRDVAVGDVKYKRFDGAKFRHSDLYQMVAYCSALGLQRGTLIYAGEPTVEVQKVVGTSIEIEVIGVDLEGSAADVLRSGARAAWRLIEPAVPYQSATGQS